MQTIFVAADGPNGIVLELPADFELEPGTRFAAEYSGTQIVLTPLDSAPEESQPYTVADIRSEVRSIAEENQVQRLWLFGEYTSGTADEEDIIRFLVETAGHGDLDDVLPDLVRAFRVPVQVVDARDRDRIPADILGEPLLLFTAES